MNPKPEQYRDAFCAAYWGNDILLLQTSNSGGIELKIGELGNPDFQVIEITPEDADRLIVSLSAAIEFIKAKEKDGTDKE